MVGLVSKKKSRRSVMRVLETKDKKICGNAKFCHQRKKAFREERLFRHFYQTKLNVCAFTPLQI
jgi:hypothetical protein